MTRVEHPISFRRSGRFRSVDLSAMGTVHLDAYIRMMEETEYEFLRSRGLSVVLSDSRGIIGFPRLSTEIEIHQFVDDDRELDVTLKLVDIDGKQIGYQFEIVDSQTTDARVASGRFVVACCRFPGHRLPYAILTPDDVLEKLTKPLQADARPSPSVCTAATVRPHQDDRNEPLKRKPKRLSPRSPGPATD